MKEKRKCYKLSVRDNPITLRYNIALGGIIEMNHYNNRQSIAFPSHELWLHAAVLLLSILFILTTLSSALCPAYAAAKRHSTTESETVPVKYVTTHSVALNVRWNDDHPCDVYMNGRLMKAGVWRGGWRYDKAYPDTKYHIVVKREDNQKTVLNEEVTNSITAPDVKSLHNNILRWYKVRGAAAYQVYGKINGRKTRIAQTTRTFCRVPASAGTLTLYALSNSGERSPKTTFRPSACKSYQNMRTLIEGDSITCPNYGYADYAAARLGMNYTNSAVSGSFLSYSDGSKIPVKLSVYTRLMHRTDLNQFQLIIISAGVNDYLYSQPMGTESSNSGTFLGAYYKIARLLKEKTHARVILVMPQEMYQGSLRGYGTTWRNRCGYTLIEERRTIQKLADKYHFETFTPTVLTKSNIQKDTLDNLHPNGTAHIQIGKQFMRYLTQNAK